jgi:hypothetical protein
MVKPINTSGCANSEARDGTSFAVERRGI